MLRKRNAQRIFAWLMLVSMILTMLPQPIVAAGVEPGYSQYPVTFTSKSAVANDTVYTTSPWSGRIGVDGNQLGSQIPSGAYVVITVDSTYLDTFTVPPAEIVTGSSLNKNAGPNTWKMTVNLDKLDSATTATFLYNLRFKHRIVPEGYTLTPQVDLFIPAGGPGTADDIHIGTSVGDITMQPTAKVKTISRF